jgi:hypothetical protein
MASRHRRPAWPTLAAAIVVGVVTVGFVAYAVAALAGLDPTQVAASREATQLGLDGRGERMVTLVTVALVLAVSIVTAAQGVGLLLRRPGARHAALLTFAVLGLLALVTAVPGTLVDPPRPAARWGVLTGLADLAVVVLLLLPATADDFELVERNRSRPPPRGDPRHVPTHGGLRDGSGHLR